MPIGLSCFWVNFSALSPAVLIVSLIVIQSRRSLSGNLHML